MKSLLPEFEDIPLQLWIIGSCVLVIAWDVYWMRKQQAAILALLQEQHIRATSPDPVARPSSHERLSSEKPA